MNLTTQVNYLAPANFSYSSPVVYAVGVSASNALVFSGSGGPAVSYSIAADPPLAASTPPTAGLALNISENPDPPVVGGSTDQSVYIGMTATFSVTATSLVPLKYLWYVNHGDGNVLLVGETGTSYTTPQITASGSAGSYTAIVSNDYGNSVTNRAGLLTVKGHSNGTVFIVGGLAPLTTADVFAGTRFNAPTATLHYQICHNTATLLPNGTVLIAGGMGGTGYPVTAELYRCPPALAPLPANTWR